MPDKLIIDCSTGEQRTEPLTAAEMADAATRAADATQRQQTEQTHSGNDATIRQALDDALTALQATITTPPANLAQCSQKIVQQARILKGLIRLVNQRLDAAD